MASKLSKAKAKGGSQTLAFKRHLSFDHKFDEENVIEITPAYPPQKSQLPQRYNCFGYADDGGRYELLLNAIGRGRTRLAKTFIALLPPRSAVDAVTPTGENSVMLALQAIDDAKKRRKMIELLVSHGANVKYVNPHTGETVLHYCCGKVPERLGDLKWFLSRWPVEMDIAQPDFKGNNALHTAVASGDFAIVVALLRVAYKSHTDLDTPNNEKLTPYLLAHKLGHQEIAEIIDKTAGNGISALDIYLTISARTNSGRRSVPEDSEIIFPVLVNHTLPARFDGFHMPVRHRTAIRLEGNEERLSKSFDEIVKKRIGVLIRGQPEYYPRIPLPSAIVRRQTESRNLRHRSLQNLNDTLALLPDYAITQEMKMQPTYMPISNRPSVSIRKTMSITGGKTNQKGN